MGSNEDVGSIEVVGSIEGVDCREGVDSRSWDDWVEGLNCSVVVVSVKVEDSREEVDKEDVDSRECVRECVDLKGYWEEGMDSKEGVG